MIDLVQIPIHFWSGRGFIGTAIRWFTWGPVSHVAMQVGDRLFEAREFRGVIENYAAAELVSRPPSKTLWLPVSDKQKNKLLDWWEARIGLPYDYLGVFRFVTRRPETEAAKPRYFCSEAVFDACEFAGVQLHARVDGSKVSPTWIYRSVLLKEKG